MGDVTWWQWVLVVIAVWMVGGTAVVYLWLVRGMRKIERDVLARCSRGPICHGDQHGWDCPLSDPTGDHLLAMMDPVENPVQAEQRRRTVEKWLADHPVD